MPKINGTRLPNPPWGESTLEIVLQYYDGPRLLLQKSQSEQLFLAWWSDTYESIERWIHLPVSKSRLHQILSGQISSLDALNYPEEGHLYVTDTDMRTEAIVQTLMTDAAALPQDAMPLPGARLNIPVPSEIDDTPTRENVHPSNILHATTDPDLLARLKQMLSSANRADIAVGYFFMSGFGAVADELSRLSKTRILVGRADRQTLEAVALGLQQSDALKSRLETDSVVQRRNRSAIAQNAVDNIVSGVSALPQTTDSQRAVQRLRDMIAAGFLEVRAYPRGLLHAKAYLCWYDSHAEPGAAIVGSSNFTLAGFTGNTELNVRVTGDVEMAELSRWFDELWADSVDISDDVALELDRSWAIARTPPYHVYLKSLYELYGKNLVGEGDLPLSTARAGYARQLPAGCGALGTLHHRQVWRLLHWRRRRSGQDLYWR